MTTSEGKVTVAVVLLLQSLVSIIIIFIPIQWNGGTQRHS